MEIRLILNQLILLFLLCPYVYSESANKIPILLSIPLSGNAAYHGEQALNGANLALSELPAELQNKIELIVEDDQLNPVKAVAAFKKHPEAKGLISFSSGTANAVAPLAETNQIVHVAIASDKKVVDNREYSFLHWVIPEEEAKILSEEMIRRKYQKITLVSTEHEGAYAVLNAIKAEFERKGLTSKVVLEEIFMPDNYDFKSFIIKAKQYKTDAVAILLFPGAIANFAKQTKQLNLGADLVGIELFEDENEVKASNGVLIGQWYIHSDLATKQFTENYQKKFGKYPTAYAANIYDSIKLLATSLSQSANPMEAAKYLSTLQNYDGAAGTYSATGDHRFSLKAAVKVITENGFEKLKIVP